MHLEVSGSNPPILYLHGGGVSGWMWKPLVTHLSNHFGSIVPDLPGHGHSTDKNYIDHESTVAELASIIRNIAPLGVHVVGFSLGAQVAIMLASRYPDLVLSAVIVSGETVPAPMPRITLALLRWAFPLAHKEWFARAQAKQLAVPEEFMSDYIQNSRTISRDTLVNSVRENIQFTLPPEWSNFAGKVAVLVGEKERGLMHRSAHNTHQALEGSTLTVVPGSAHDIPFTAPETLGNVIRDVTQTPCR